MRQKHGPIHYIAQPTFPVHTGKMQKNFIVKKDKKSAAFDINGQEMVKHFKPTQADYSSTKQNQTQVKQDVRQSLQIEKRSFKEMDIEERIDFLLHRPFYIPASPCEIKTAQQSYFGFIENEKGSEIIFRPLNETGLVTISRQAITEILLLRM